ncbi:MAG: hypothetical protein GC204_16205 [Chloroflexi bacterium]|nr:hypothetical protein [Chloroflexota bacterium]
MSRTHQRWALLSILIFAVVVAACSPTATPTPTTRPTATEVPPTTAAEASTAEAAATAESTSAVTAEATKASVSLDATLPPFVAQSPTPTSEATEMATEAMSATEEMTMEATEMMAAPTEEMTMEATEMMAAPTEEMTEMMAAPTEEMTMEATEMMAAPTEEMTEMAAPTEEMTAAPTEEMTMEATEMMAPTEEMTMEATMEATAELGTIIDVAKADGNFTTLLAAIDKADLTKTLEGDGPFTVFAPTDDAFKALLTATNMTAADLLSNPDLAKILMYHVVDGKITADDFAEFKSVDNPDLIVVPTLDGDQKLNITVEQDGTIMINGVAKVTLKNVMASNGVIHVIDAVLMPADVATPEATASS